MNAALPACALVADAEATASAATGTCRALRSATPVQRKRTRGWRPPWPRHVAAGALSRCRAERVRPGAGSFTAAAGQAASQRGWSRSAFQRHSSPLCLTDPPFKATKGTGAERQRHGAGRSGLGPSGRVEPAVGCCPALPLNATRRPVGCRHAGPVLLKSKSPSVASTPCPGRIHCLPLWSRVPLSRESTLCRTGVCRTRLRGEMLE